MAQAGTHYPTLIPFNPTHRPSNNPPPVAEYRINPKF